LGTYILLIGNHNIKNPTREKVEELLVSKTKESYVYNQHFTFDENSAKDNEAPVQLMFDSENTELIFGKHLFTYTCNFSSKCLPHEDVMDRFFEEFTPLQKLFKIGEYILHYQDQYSDMVIELTYDEAIKKLKEFDPIVESYKEISTVENNIIDWKGFTIIKSN